jgi:NTE family protein
VKAPRSRKFPTIPQPLPFSCVALLLQGGGALGAYQGGVYQAMAEAELLPSWISGISIGAINAALIAGNPPETRVDQLRRFWERITASPANAAADIVAKFMTGDTTRSLLNEMSAVRTLMTGAPGFFVPRPVVPFLAQPGALAATSFYDTSALKSTLEELVDFDRINAGETRFSVAAVNIRSGNFVYFDNATHHIRPEHVMASGALPPGFNAVEIDGESYWDGGLISNTPLSWVLNATPRHDTLAFQVDLWSARGSEPRTMADVAVRQKEIQYSSRTRAETDHFKEMQRLRFALARLLDKLPEAIRKEPDAVYLHEQADRSRYNIVELIYRSKHYEDQTRDFEFSRLTMEDHWQAGLNDARRTLRHPETYQLPTNSDGVFTFDWNEDGTE